MLLRDISFNSPAENVLFDEVLLKCAEAGKRNETLRFWEAAQNFVVLGRISKLEEDVKCEAVRRDHVPVLRRCSGGGTVLQGPGCLNYALIFEKDRHPGIQDIRKSYAIISEKIIGALGRLGIRAGFWPTSDIALESNRKKFSGNAQKRGRRFILHHGTILYRFELEQVEKYLKIPQAVPEYRFNRAHREFISNIDASVSDIKREIASTFGAEKVVLGMASFEKEILDEQLKSVEHIYNIRVDSLENV